MKKRADGRYCKQVMIGYKSDGTRQMKTVYGKTIKEVEKKLSEIRKQIDLGMNLSDDLTVCQWGDTYTGMRRGEILALRVHDIDFEAGTIIVNKAVEFICNAPNIKMPKTPKSNRVIPILNPLIPYLKKAVEGKEKTDFVFTGYDGKLYTKSAIQRLFKAFNRDYNRYINRFKLEDECETVHFTMHQFRHTFCTMMYDAGVDVKTAQDILGHSSVNVTLDIYTHLSRQKKKISVDKMNAYIESQLKA